MFFNNRRVIYCYGVADKATDLPSNTHSQDREQRTNYVKRNLTNGLRNFTQRASY